MFPPGNVEDPDSPFFQNNLNAWVEGRFKYLWDPNYHTEALYDLDTFEAAQTHDELWNAAQRQLRGAGVVHNALRMYWGKMILAWSRSPQEALAIAFQGQVNGTL